jgi:DNA-binding CsgD family transcriptional regulator
MRCRCSISKSNLMNLTPKEAEFIRLKAQGLKMVEIAELMFMSERSIFGFANDLYRKTETLNGSNLIDWGYKNGVLKINAETLPNQERKTG